MAKDKLLGIIDGRAIYAQGGTVASYRLNSNGEKRKAPYCAVRGKKTEHTLASRYNLVWIELSQGCNLHCRHCNVSAPTGDFKSLSIETIRTDLTDLLPLIRPKKVWLSGGEPTTHPYFAEAAWSIREAVEDVTLITNGTKLHEDEILESLRCGGISCQVSLEGLDSGSISAVRGSKKAAVLILDNVKRLRKSLPNNNLILSCVLTSKTLNDADALVRFASNYGYNRVIFTFFKPLGRGRKNLDLRIPLLERVKTYQRIRNLQHKTKGIGVVLSGGVFDHLDKIEDKRFQTKYSCRLACEELQITSNGMIHCCSLMENGLVTVSIKHLVELLLADKRKIMINDRIVCPVLSVN